MKKIFYYVMALALGCSQMSCSDLLDQKPQGVLTEDDLTGGTYETQIFNMYALLRGYHIVSGNTALAIHGMRSEDAERVVHYLTDLQQEKCLMILNMLQVMAW